MGGHRFFSKSDTVMKWWTDLMPIQTVPSKDDILLNREIDLSKSDKEQDPNKTDDVMLVRNRLSRIYFLKTFFDYPVSLSFSTMKNLIVILLKNVIAQILPLARKLLKKSIYEIISF